MNRAAVKPPLKAVFFDFDGVILESADIKTAAFAALFDGFPKHRSRILAYHLGNAGLSRFKKFDHIYRNILKRPLPPSERRRLGAAFSRLVLEKVLASPAVAGAGELLRRYGPRLRLFVLSGTPQAELRRIVKRRGFSDFFRGVYGSPRTKEDLLTSLLRRHRLSPAETAYVGDAMSDFRAASSRDIPFVGRVPRGRRSPFPRGTACVRDMRGFASWLGRRIG